MKKYRCPCCGEECITLRKRFFIYNLSSPIHDYSGSSCPECGGRFIPYEKSAIKSYIEYAFLIAFLLALLYLTIFVSAIYVLIIIAYLLLLLPLVIFPILKIKLPIVGFRRADYSARREYILPEHNSKVMIELTNGKIKDLGIYGIRFDKKTNNTRFHETFTNDLVPVVFHKKDKKQGGETEVTIMEKEFIPGELLFYGSKFTVIDNGKEIASGFIQTVYE